ncbi:MAG: phospholipase D-like domain-containing protein [Bacteroidia bacterium]
MFSKLLEWIRGKTVRIEVDLDTLHQKKNEFEKQIKPKMLPSDWQRLRGQIFHSARNQVLENNRLIKLVNWLEDSIQHFTQKEMLSYQNQPPKVVHQTQTVAVPTLTGAQVFFSPGKECLNEIVSALRSATTTADICVFTISDDRITKEIIAAHKRRVKVRVITDDEKVLDTGSDIQQMKTQGIEIRTDHGSGHMHHKFAIFDDKTLLNGSYNWTRSASEYNYENLMVAKDKKLINDFSGEFEELWEKLKEF